MINLNDELNVKIIDFETFGRGVAKPGDFTVFVDKAIPDEECLIRITEKKKNYANGIIISHKKISPDRINSACPCYDKCGGCDLRHITYELECSFKENLVRSAFSRGQIDVKKFNSIIRNKKPDHYRNKVIFHSQNNIGLYEKNSNNIIPIKECLLVSENINKIYSFVLENYMPRDFSKLLIREGLGSNEILISVDTKNKFDYKKLTILKEVKSILINGKIVYGSRTIKEILNGITFEISASSFFQVNTIQASKMFDIISSYFRNMGNYNVIDLYSGTGSISLSVAPFVKSVLGIEEVRGSVKAAINNAKTNNIKNVKFECGKAEELLSDLDLTYDAIIVDPPREGLDSKVIEAILESKATEVIYVSCNPGTLIRDLKKLTETYECAEVTPLDMFSRTHHIETVVLLKRRKIKKGKYHTMKIA